jgi:Family of unknown function (DUF6338)
LDDGVAAFPVGTGFVVYSPGERDLTGTEFGFRPPTRPQARAGRPAAGEHQAYLSAWWLLFTANPDSRIHVGCLLDDGSYVAGILRSFNQASDDVQDRELMLTGPISYRVPGAPQTTELPGVGAAAVNARRLQLIMVSCLTEDPKADESPSRPPTE